MAFAEILWLQKDTDKIFRLASSYRGLNLDHCGDDGFNDLQELIDYYELQEGDRIHVDVYVKKSVDVIEVIEDGGYETVESLKN